MNSRTRAQPQKTAAFSGIKVAHTCQAVRELDFQKPAEIRHGARVRELKAPRRASNLVDRAGTRLDQTSCAG
jgi:hypothetical protein